MVLLVAACSAGQAAIYYIDDTGATNAPGSTVAYSPAASWTVYTAPSGVYCYGGSYTYERVGTTKPRTATFTFAGPEDDYYVYAGWAPAAATARTQDGTITANGLTDSIVSYPVNHEKLADGTTPPTGFRASGFWPVQAVAGSALAPIHLGPGSTIVYSDGTEADADQCISADVVVVSTDPLIDNLSPLATDVNSAYSLGANAAGYQAGEYSNGYDLANSPTSADVFRYDLGTALGGAATRDVKVSWVGTTTRDASVTYRLTHANGTTDIVVNQKELADRTLVATGLAWSGFRSLGVFDLDASSTLEIIPSGSGSVAADTIALGADPRTLYERAMQSQPTDCTNYLPLNYPDLADKVGTLSATGASGTSAAPDVLGRLDGATALDGSSSSKITFAPGTSAFADSGTCEAFLRVDTVTSDSNTVQMAISSRTTASSSDRFYLGARQNPGDSSQYVITATFGDAYPGVNILADSKSNLGEWRYVAFSWAKNTGTGKYDIKTYYTDAAGQIVAGGTMSTGGTPPVGAPIQFGGYPFNSSHQFDGGMDNVAFYTGALTAGQLQQHYNIATYTAEPQLSQYQQGVLATPGLAHYWPLDNRAAEDIIGTVDRATIGSTVVTTAGITGQAGSAMVFNGATTSMAKFDAAPEARITLGNAGTLEAWIRADSIISSDRFAISMRSAEPAADRFYLRAENGWLEYSFGNQYQSTGVITDVSGRLGEWVYTAITWEKIGANFLVSSYYADESGHLWAGDATALTGGTPPTDALLAFGGYVNNTGYMFAGGVDEVAIYDRLLSLEEMQDHWRLSVPEPTTVTMLLGGLAALVRRRRRR